MSVFLAYGLSRKNKQMFIYLSFLFTVSVILLMIFNSSSFTFYNPNETNTPFGVYMSYFALSCLVYLFFNLLSVLKDYLRYTSNPFYSYSGEFRLLLTQREKLLERVFLLKKIYHSMITPSESFLGNLENNKTQFRYVEKQVGSREHAKEQYKELIRLENKLKGDKPFLKADAHCLYQLAFLYEYNKLVKLFTIK